MAASRTRAEARARAFQVFQEQLDRMIPADEAVPLKGQQFAEFEDQVEALGRQVLPVLLEERAALDPAALADTAGVCPHCQSGRTHLEHRRSANVERAGPSGPVVLFQQQARCRACGRSFSPSGA